MIRAWNSDAAMSPCCLHNAVNTATIGVIGLEYLTHCCTHSPNVCRMTWTASCWLVPMGGWRLCRSWWQGITWTSTRRTRYFCTYNWMYWDLSCNIQLQLSCGSECHALQFFSTCESLQRRQLFAIIIHEDSPSQLGLPLTFASPPMYNDKNNKGVSVQNMWHKLKYNARCFGREVFVNCKYTMTQTSGLKHPEFLYLYSTMTFVSKRIATFAPYCAQKCLCYSSLM